MSVLGDMPRLTMGALASCAAALVALALLAAPAAAIPGHVRFQYTGGEQEYKVPAGVTMLSFSLQGGWGGGYGGVSEAGAQTYGFLPVTPGQTFYVEVGANGEYGATTSNFGGGGPGGTPPPDNCAGSNGEPCGGSLANSGGGASDVRTVPLGQPGSLASRLIVAAGAGGNGGGGNSRPLCGVFQGYGGRAENAQPLPQGNAEDGPLPIAVPGGTVVPGLYSESHRSLTVYDGFTDASPGTDSGGAGGAATECTSSETTGFESLPGLEGSEGQGGGGGDAESLQAAQVLGCWKVGNACANAGAGGGGGGGYFGGGGGATGYNRCSHPTSECDSAGFGQGGAAGSSFFSDEAIWPTMGNVAAVGTGVTLVTLLPDEEITSPAPGANYAPGSLVTANWACSTENADGAAGIENCTATKGNGEALDTSKGVHTFSVTGLTRIDGLPAKPVTSTVTYTSLEAPTVTKVKPAHGPVGGGATVTITGTNFEDVTAVSFGGVAAASFKVLSPTSIQAVAPASAPGKVTLTVTTGGGASAVALKGDTYKFTPTVASVTPDEGPLAGGTRVTITGTGFATAPGATKVKLGKAKATEVSCASASSCTATAPPGLAAGPVDVKVTVAKAASPKAQPGDVFTYR